MIDSNEGSRNSAITSPDGEVAIQDQPTLKSYRAYAGLIAEYGRLSPQHQGLTAQEFAEALDDPAVAKTTVIQGEEQLQIPQLAPVERNHWLNAGFYATTFPDEYSRGDVLHFVDIPGVKPGAEVQARLKGLAANRGVVVFDYPTSDPEYPNRVRSFLGQTGIQTGDVQLLGSQTYFAGQTKLLRRQYPLPPPTDLATTYEQAVADGIYDESRRENGVSVVRRVDEVQAQRMLRFYEDAYQVLNDHPCKQGLSPQEFMEIMTEYDHVPKVINTVDGTIVALCLLDTNLQELSWVNADFYSHKYPEKTATDQVTWFPGLAADPASEVVHNTEAMVGLISELGELGNNDMLVVFDAGDMNTGFLDKFLEKLINNTPQASVAINPIAVQRYCAIQTELKQ